jgi:hypothetical protein
VIEIGGFEGGAVVMICSSIVWEGCIRGACCVDLVSSTIINSRPSKHDDVYKLAISKTCSSIFLVLLMGARDNRLEAPFSPRVRI